MSLRTVLSIALPMAHTAAAGGRFASYEQTEVFATPALPGALTGCRRLPMSYLRSMLDCQMLWMRLRQLNAKLGFIRYNASDNMEGCEVSAWCDQLLVNESDPLTALLPVSLGQPRLVLFAVKSGSQLNVLDSFLTPIGCKPSLLVSPAVGPPPIDFWRSCWLDRLPDLMRLLSGKTLSVEILKDGATVLKISFDASFAGLSLTNWFGKDRLVGSEPDFAMASRDYNYFSIIGYSNFPFNRTFFIYMNFGGCSTSMDAGILAVIERDEYCAWGMTGGGIGLPRTLYTLANGAWENRAVLAGYLLVTAA